MILTEMVHDARIVRMNAQHLPKTIRKWMGDSVGRWEGDTLVVDTTNFTRPDSLVVQAAPAELFMVESLGARTAPGPQDLHVVERFTRVADNALLYRFTVEDPARGSRRGPVNSPGRRPTSTFTSTRATRQLRDGEHLARRARAKPTPRRKVGVCSVRL